MQVNISLSIWFLSAISLCPAAFAEDQFSRLACQVQEYTGEAPEILGFTSYPVDSDGGMAEQCDTLLVFENRETALVERTLSKENLDQVQVVLVSTTNNTIRPIIGRSQQTRDRTSSRSFAEGGNRGGSKLPLMTERIAVKAARSMGKHRIGIETFQIRFTVKQSFKTTFESSQVTQREQKPVVEFDLCGRRVNLEAGLYSAVAAKHSTCENYTKSELEAFTKFWEF